MSLIYPSDEYLPARRRGPSFAPMIIAAALATVALAGQTKLGAWLRGFFAPPRQSRYHDQVVRQVRGGLSLPALRNSIIGKSMARLVSTFGLPRTVNASGSNVIESGNADAGGFWRSDTWYYVLDPAAQTAMAIHFEGGIARHVEFFGVPTSIES